MAKTVFSKAGVDQHHDEADAAAIEHQLIDVQFLENLTSGHSHGGK
jgi:hypothetical protein